MAQVHRDRPDFKEEDFTTGNYGVTITSQFKDTLGDPERRQA